MRRAGSRSGPGSSVQPSEFPQAGLRRGQRLAVRLQQHAARAAGKFFPGYLFAVVLFGAVLMVLMAQPDFGMTFVSHLADLVFAEFFLAGLPMLAVLALAVMAMGGLVGAYYIFPHVASRVDRFPGPGRRRHLSGRSLARSLHPWRADRAPGPARGTVEAVPARRPCRFHLRRRG